MAGSGCMRQSHRMAHWVTADEITAARDAFELAVEGWQRPVAHGVGLVPSGAAGPRPEHFPLVNSEDHRLPGVVVAHVVGHTSGTAAYRLTRSQLERAVAMLTPAEVCEVYQHPNLWTWRDTYLPRLDVDPGATLVAVFLGEEPELAPDPAIDAFRAARSARAGG